MEYRIEDLVEGLTYAQLLRMQFDLNHGSLQLKKLVDSRIKQLEQANRRVCATCNCPIMDDSDHVYTLMFGPSDFRKKATCCGMDCFDEFVKKVKEYEGIKLHGV
jgi:hypothetical protein